MFLSIVKSQIEEVYRIDEKDIGLGMGPGDSDVTGVDLRLEILIRSIQE
jgi:hypothetical protein